MEQEEYQQITRQLVSIMAHQEAVNTRLDRSIELFAQLATKYDIQLAQHGERAESHAQRLAALEAIAQRLDATIARMDRLINTQRDNGQEA